MALILSIDTATALCSVCLAENGQPLQVYKHEQQKDHAALLAVFIRQLTDEYHLNNNTLQAIAISAGPGSYTGLRVAAATAKGLCYAFEIPLIAINTLHLMASGMKNKIQHSTAKIAVFLCPMIEARRNEVFTALYNHNLETISAPQALIITEKILEEYLSQHDIIFFGDGSNKLKPLLKNNKHALFYDYQISAEHLSGLAENAYQAKDFQDIAYFEPYYLKSFYQPPAL